MPNDVAGIAYGFVRSVTEFLAYELVLPVGCFVFVIGHEARYNERHILCAMSKLLFLEDEAG